MPTIADLQLGQTATITECSSEAIPFKLLEMGCLPGNKVKLLQVAPFLDPLYLNIDDAFVAIRRDTAALICIEIDSNE
jgi:ferrous iron transport protein A